MHQWHSEVLLHRGVAQMCCIQVTHHSASASSRLSSEHKNKCKHSEHVQAQDKQ